MTSEATTATQTATLEDTIALEEYFHQHADLELEGEDRAGITFIPASAFSIKQKDFDWMAAHRPSDEVGDEMMIRGIDHSTNSRVTLKIHSVDKGFPDLTTRLRVSVRTTLNEAKTLQGLDHPNIIKCKGVTLIKTRTGLIAPALVLEDINGPTLEDVLTQDTLSGEETVRILAPIADALDYCHDMGVIHNFVIPRSIVLDYDGRPVLTNFSISGDKSWIIATWPNEIDDEMNSLINVALACFGIRSDFHDRVDQEKIHHSKLPKQIKKIFRPHNYCRGLIEQLEEAVNRIRLEEVDKFYKDKQKRWVSNFSKRNVFLAAHEPNDPRLTRIDDLVRQLAEMLPKQSTFLDLGFGPTGRDLRDVIALTRKSGKTALVIGAELVRENIISAFQDPDKTKLNLRGKLAQANIRACLKTPFIRSTSQFVLT